MAQVSQDVMWEAVLANRPIFKKILAQYGEQALDVYFDRSVHSAVNLPDGRFAELASSVRAVLADILPATLIDSVVAQLEATGYVSTADHHGPLTHPFFSNSALMLSVAYSARGYSNVIVLPCAGISLDNSSFPRGFLMHDTALTELRFPILSRKHYFEPVFTHAPYTKEDCVRVRRQILTSTLSNDVKAKWIKEILPIYESEKALSFSSYARQILYTNYILWKKIPGQENTNLIYLPQESLVIDLLLKYHLSGATDVYEILCNSRWHNLFAKYFDGIPGAFSTKKNKGTFLFWYIQQGKRQPLSQEQGALVAPDGTRILLDAVSLRRELLSGRLIPSMALTFIVLSFYYGLHAGGGFSQVNYLTQMKSVYLQMLEELGRKDAYPYLTEVDTQYFCADFVISCMRNERHVVPATLHDLILYSGNELTQKIKKLASELSLKRAIEILLPDLYAMEHRAVATTTPVVGYLPYSDIAMTIEL